MVAVVLQAMRCMSLALIISTLIDLSLNILFPGSELLLMNLDFISLVLAVTAFILIRKDVINPILVLIGCGAVRILLSLVPGL